MRCLKGESMTRRLFLLLKYLGMENCVMEQFSNSDPIWYEKDIVIYMLKQLNVIKTRIFNKCMLKDRVECTIDNVKNHFFLSYRNKKGIYEEKIISYVSLPVVSYIESGMGFF